MCQKLWQSFRVLWSGAALGQDTAFGLALAFPGPSSGRGPPYRVRGSMESETCQLEHATFLSHIAFPGLTWAVASFSHP